MSATMDRLVLIAEQMKRMLATAQADYDEACHSIEAEMVREAEDAKRAADFVALAAAVAPVPEPEAPAPEPVANYPVPMNMVDAEALPGQSTAAPGPPQASPEELLAGDQVQEAPAETPEN